MRECCRGEGGVIGPSQRKSDARPGASPLIVATRDVPGRFLLSLPWTLPESARVAVFDLDRTLIRLPALVAFAPALRRTGLLGCTAILRVMAAQPAYLRRALDDAEVSHLGVVLLSVVRGWEAAAVRRAVGDATPRVLARILYGNARGLLAAHRDAGDVVVIASSTPSDIVVPIATALGAQVALATTAQITADGRYTGHLEQLCYGPNKATAFVALAHDLDVDPSCTTAYSDAISDLPLLEAVGRPVVTNAERSLLSVARARGWPTLDLKRCAPDCAAAHGARVERP